MRWSISEIRELKGNFQYYNDNKRKAKIYFGRKWQCIRIKANQLNVTNLVFTTNQLKNLKKKYFYYINHKKEAESCFKREWKYINKKATQLKITSMQINKNCSVFLGCHVAERVLSYVFKDVQRMPNGNRGYDFICNKGFKIDVKASCLQKNNTYVFVTKYNKIADYFLCIAFDNRKDLNPQHIWLIKSDDVCVIDKKKRLFRDICAVNIKNDSDTLSKFSKYELVDKLKETTECCTELKSEHENEVKIIRRRKVINAI